MITFVFVYKIHEDLTDVITVTINGYFCTLGLLICNSVRL